jgi:site-specific DNA-methyltransferase (adenine-specific)
MDFQMHIGISIQQNSFKIINGDAVQILSEMPAESVHCIVTDPPYGETSLQWDKASNAWISAVHRVLRRDGSMWVFGSMRSLMGCSWEGWNFAQDVVWEKHNGSGSANDRFRRVHEHAAQFYRSDAKWRDVYKQPLFTNDATARTVTRTKGPPQWGKIGNVHYETHNGGPRLMRSVMFCRSMNGKAEHPTQKPIEIVSPLIEYSCPAGGVVLDPFLGSGTTALAAKQLGRSCIGIEIDAKYVAIAERRLGVK